MATRVAPTPPDADNPAGSFTLAACNDWRFGVRRFHVGTGHYEPTHDAGYTTAGSPSRPPLSISLLLPRGSPYTRLGTTCCLRIEWKDNLSCCVLQHEIVANGVEQPTLHALLPFGREREPNATYFYAGLDRNIFARIDTGNQIPPERRGVCAVTLQREIVEIAIARARIDSAQHRVRR